MVVAPRCLVGSDDTDTQIVGRIRDFGQLKSYREGQDGLGRLADK
jgi:hypothetical protein